MSSRLGPMAWGSQGQVFLGEDLMHTRDYSDETARVIDEEVERILREQENRCREVLTANRNGLDLVARSLLEHETISGSEVSRLIQLGSHGTTVDSLPSAAPSAAPVVPVPAEPGAVGAGGEDGGNGDGSGAGHPSDATAEQPAPTGWS
jgi:cell division protease FtsH